MCPETKEIATPACSCLDLTILTWLFVAGWVYLLRLDKQFVSFRLPIPDNDLMFNLVLPQSLHTYPMNTSTTPTLTHLTFGECECSKASLCWLILLTVWDQTHGLRFVFGLLLRISTARK